MLKIRQPFYRQCKHFRKLRVVLSLHLVLASTSQKSQMTLKIEKVSDGGKSVIRLSGRLQSEHLDELKKQMRGNQSRIALDLDGVTLVDVEGVRFLHDCEATESNCSIACPISENG
jgi:ABC-type transporter Mla MlaB component